MCWKKIGLQDGTVGEFRAGVLLVSAMMVLSGCVTDSSVVPVETSAVEMPAELKQETLSFLTARVIDKICPSVGINVARQEQLAYRADAVFKEAGVPFRFFSPEDVVSRDEANRHFAEYMTQRGLKEGDTAGFCAVGNTEIDDQTQIGSFLKKR
jgi:hypothetical protein